MAFYKLIFGFLLLTFIATPLTGGVVQVNGKWCEARYVPTHTVAEHYERGGQALSEKNWDEALTHFVIITIHFEASPFYNDALFYSGVVYYHLNDFELANTQLSKYLNLGSSLRHFEQVLEYKYHIAEQYAQGAKKRIFGINKLPKIISARGDAIVLYDEVIGSLPNGDLAAHALFGKGALQRKMKEFKESVETFTALTRRFPKHDLAATSFLVISEIYLEQSKLEPQNPDIIGLAKVNLQRALRQFPGDEKLRVIDENLLSMKDAQAKSLYNIAQFYEKKRKPKASIIYYKETAKKFPETSWAEKSRERIRVLEGLS